mgnify:CR=1 FL=1
MPVTQEKSQVAVRIDHKTQADHHRNAIIAQTLQELKTVDQLRNQQKTKSWRVFVE